MNKFYHQVVPAMLFGANSYTTKPKLPKNPNTIKVLPKANLPPSLVAVGIGWPVVILAFLELHIIESVFVG